MKTTTRKTHGPVAWPMCTSIMAMMSATSVLSRASPRPKAAMMVRMTRYLIERQAWSGVMHPMATSANMSRNESGRIGTASAYQIETMTMTTIAMIDE